jgi:hypothetical protein
VTEARAKRTATTSNLNGDDHGAALTPVTTETLQAFADAWNRHDVDALMSFMADDCVFEASAGPEVFGQRHVGRDAVRAAYAEVWATFSDAHGAARATSCRAIGASPNGPSRARGPTARASKSTAATCSPFEATRSTRRIRTARIARRSPPRLRGRPRDDRPQRAGEDEEP